MIVECISSFIKNGDTHFVVDGHVALTGDKVEHLISTDTLALTCCAVLARAKPGEHLGITYLDVEDMMQTFRRYTSVVVEKREPCPFTVAPKAPSVLLPLLVGDAILTGPADTPNTTDMVQSGSHV